MTQFKIIGTSKSTGKDVEIIVEAGDYKEAELKAIDMDLLVSKVLPVGEPVKDAPVNASCPQSPADQLRMAITCPKCNNSAWSGGRGDFLWFCVVFFFPLGLLLLLFRPEWRCVSCDYFYLSYRTPAGFSREGTHPLVRAIKLYLITVILLMILMPIFLALVSNFL